MDTAKPGGTGISAAISSPRVALLPPNEALSSRRRSARRSGVTGAGHSRIVTVPAVPSTRMRCPVLICEVARPVPDDGGQPVFTADDRGMGHDAADVGDRRLDLREDRRPGGRGDAADEDLALADVADLARRLDDAGEAFDHPRRGRGAAQLRATLLVPRPLVDSLRRHAPEHDQRRVHHHLGHCADRRRRRPVGEPLEQLAPLRDDRRPVLRAARPPAGRPRQQELVERRVHLEAGQLEDAVAVGRGSRARRAGRRTRGSCSTSSSGTSSRR